jgi:hypothetical protein
MEPTIVKDADEFVEEYKESQAISAVPDPEA